MPAPPSFSVTPLGAGQEVGRSAILVKGGGATLLLDCGAHPAFVGVASLPFLDDVDVDELDAVLITHFHLDHVAGLPYLVGRLGYKGPILMTHATRCVTELILGDSVSRQDRGGRKRGRGGPGEASDRSGAGGAPGGDPSSAGRTEALWDRSDLEQALAQTVCIDFDAPRVLPIVRKSSDGPNGDAGDPAPGKGGARGLVGGGLPGSSSASESSPLRSHVTVTARRAGHVLGAAMFEIELPTGSRVLYTGDYSRVPDRHMPAAGLPAYRPDALIVESTFGVSRHEPRRAREGRLVSFARAALARGGSVLIPIVALGRAQEVLLVLEQAWAALDREASRSGRDSRAEARRTRGGAGAGAGGTGTGGHGASSGPDASRPASSSSLPPIYVLSGVTASASGIYRAFVDSMKEDVARAAARGENPLDFPRVCVASSASALLEAQQGRPCIALATPSQLQSGHSRELFEAWAPDPRNLLMIADFAVQGTLARQALSGPPDIQALDGSRVPLRCQVETVSFSAHADFPQTAEYVDLVDPDHVILVHGEVSGMLRLQRALEARAKARGRENRAVHAPRNLQAVVIEHPQRVLVRVAGQLAEEREQPHDNQHGRPTSDNNYTNNSNNNNTNSNTNNINHASPSPALQPPGSLGVPLTGAGGALSPLQPPASAAHDAAAHHVQGIVVASDPALTPTALAALRARPRLARPVEALSLSGTAVARGDLARLAGIAAAGVRVGQRVALLCPWRHARLALELAFEGAGGVGELGDGTVRGKEEPGTHDDGAAAAAATSRWADGAEDPTHPVTLSLGGLVEATFNPGLKKAAPAAAALELARAKREPAVATDDDGDEAEGGGRGLDEGDGTPSSAISAGKRKAERGPADAVDALPPSDASAAAYALPPYVSLRWRSSAAADAAADAAVAALLGAGSDPAEALRAEAELRSARARADPRAARAATLQVLSALLSAQFGPLTADRSAGVAVLDVDGAHVLLDLASFDVRAADKALETRVKAAVERILVLAQGVAQSCA